MKIAILPILAGLATYCIPNTAGTQQFQEHISKTFTLSKGASLSTLAIYNVNGPVRVEGYSGDKVQIEIDKTITGKSDSALAKGKEEFKVEFEQNADSITAYISAPFDSRPDRHHDRRDEGDHHVDYSFRLEYTIKVPSALNLAVNTINGGEVSVYNVSGAIHAHNINSAVTINNASGITDAATINGDLTINYITSPPGGCSFHTINGTIRASYPADLSADLEFKSLHGSYYTNFPNAQIMPAVVVKNQIGEGKDMVYKLNKSTAVRIGQGGKTFRFETLNGNIFIKKQS